MFKKFATAELEVVTGKEARNFAREASRANFSFTPRPGFLYTRTRAISARVNRNYDGFSSGELEAAYGTFKGRPTFVNHTNHDPKRARGVVLCSAYHAIPNDQHIELLMEVDGERFPRLAKHILDGDIDSVSMGTDVKISVCSYCDNHATTPQEFCNHILQYKGRQLPRVNRDGSKTAVLVYEDCRGLNFFEISYVFEPADETALMSEVIAPKSAATDDAVTRGEMDRQNWGQTPSEHDLASRLLEHESEAMSLAHSLGPTHPRTFDAMRQYHELAGQLRAISPGHPALDKAGQVEKIGYGEIVAPPAVDTLRDENLCPECGDENFDGVRCQWCDYATPPKELQDPDVDKARELDIRQDNKDDEDDIDKDDSSGNDSNRGEGKNVPNKAMASALARRRLAEAQQRLSDMSEQDAGKQEGHENVQNTPTPVGTGITTDNTRADETKTDVQNLDATVPGTELHPDGRTDVTDLGSEQFKYQQPKQSVKKAEISGVDDSVPEAAAPDARTNVETPVANTTDNYAQDSQFDTGKYEDNQMKDKTNPVLDNDQTWLPGQKNTRLKTASTSEVMHLTDLYMDLGLVPATQKYTAVAQFEKLPAVIAQDRIKLLELVKSAQMNAPTRTARTASRTSVPRVGAAPQPPALGRQANRTSISDVPDHLLLLS